MGFTPLSVSSRVGPANRDKPEEKTMDITLSTRRGLPGHARVHVDGKQVGLVSREPNGWTYAIYIPGEQQPLYSNEFFANRDMAVKALTQMI